MLETYILGFGKRVIELEQELSFAKETLIEKDVLIAKMELGRAFKVLMHAGLVFVIIYDFCKFLGS